MSFLEELTMISSCSNISKSFGEKHILKQVSFHLKGYEKAAIVGISDAGKSVLLEIIIGELACGEGYVALSKGASIGCLAQHQDLDSESTVHDALLEVKRPILRIEERIRSLELDMESASGEGSENILEEYSRLTHQFELEDGCACRSEITGVLKSLDFTEEGFSKPINALLGGQRTRVSLGKLLLTKPDILPLDEPTSRLDMESIAWLETYLEAYSDSAIIAARNRYFLDRVVTKIVELDSGTGTAFNGNYTAHSGKKAMLWGTRIQAYLNQQQEVRRQEAVIAKPRSFNREKSVRRAESREKMLDKIDQLEKPINIGDSIDIRLGPNVKSGKDVLTVADLSKSFDSQTLLTDVDFEVKRRERVTVIGGNGTGKTTLLKIINQLLPADAGEIRLGSKVHIGYYDQEYQILHMDKTLFDEIQDTYPSMNSTQIRNTLASFLFTGDDMFKLIRDLNGGERGRVPPAKLMLSDANSLLLGEPTNHLDITSREVLESALCRYIGTVFYVSHDRYFINRTTIRILDLTGQSLINYIGSYDYYLEKKNVVEAAFAARNSHASAVSGSSQSPNRPSRGSPNDLKLEWKAQKEEQARIRRIQDELRRTEESIHALETGDSEIDALLTLEEVYTDVSRLMELNKEKEEMAGQLEKLHQNWEELAEEA